MLNECEQFPDENSTLETEAGIVVGEKSPFHQLLGNGPDKVVGEIAC